MTAPAHVLVFRPIIEVLRARGHDVTVTARDYAQTLQLLELHGIEADGVRAPRRCLARAQARVARLAHGARPALREPRRLPARLGPRLERPRARGQVARHPRREHVRLRVRHPAAQRRLQVRPPRDDAGPDTSRPPGALRCRTGEACAVSRSQRGVLPRRLRAGSRNHGAPRRGRDARDGRDPPAARRVAVPPRAPTACSPRSRATRRRRGGSRDRGAAHRGAARVRARACGCPR